jgi:hypothetical protein
VNVLQAQLLADALGIHGEKHTQNYRVKLAHPAIDMTVILAAESEAAAIETAFDALCLELFGHFGPLSRKDFTVTAEAISEEEADAEVKKAP